jgi:signal transduction histidine kinase
MIFERQTPRRDPRNMSMQSIMPITDFPGDQKMVEYLHKLAEQFRASLSRKLHDELGGLLVSVVMDVAFAEQNLEMDDGLRKRLHRVRHCLAEAIDLKRNMIESLRPSLLDDFGLFGALKWEVKRRCETLHLPYSEIYPDTEPNFTTEASIALFRIVQESLDVVLRQRSVTTMHIVVAVDPFTLRIAVSHDGETTSTIPQDDAFAIYSIAHRVRALGGQITATGVAGGGAMYSASVPLAQLTTPLLQAPGR